MPYGPSKLTPNPPYLFLFLFIFLSDSNFRPWNTYPYLLHHPIHVDSAPAHFLSVNLTTNEHGNLRCSLSILNCDGNVCTFLKPDECFPSGGERLNLRRGDVNRCPSKTYLPYTRYRKSQYTTPVCTTNPKHVCVERVRGGDDSFRFYNTQNDRVTCDIYIYTRVRHDANLGSYVIHTLCMWDASPSKTVQK